MAGSNKLTWDCNAAGDERLCGQEGMAFPQRSSAVAPSILIARERRRASIAEPSVILSPDDLRHEIIPQRLDLFGAEHGGRGDFRRRRPEGEAVARALC